MSDGIFLDILPRFDMAATAAIMSKVQSLFKKAGAEVGAEFGVGAEAGMRRYQEALMQAETQATVAYNRMAKSAGDAQVAEARANELRAKNIEATSARMIAAENRVRDTRRTAAADYTAYAAAEKKVDEARATTAATSAAATTAVWGKAFNVVGVAATAGLALIGAESGKAAGEYEQAATRIKVATGETAADIKALSDGLLKLAPEVGYSAQKLQEAAYTVAKGGFKEAAGQLAILKAGAQLARVEGSELEPVMNGLTTTMQDFHVPTEKAADVASQLQVAIGNSKAPIDQFMGALHNFEPMMKVISDHGMDASTAIAQVGTALAVMTLNGTSADQASQNLRNSLNHLIDTLPKQKEALAQIGLNGDDLSKELMDPNKGMLGVMNEINQAMTKTFAGGNTALMSQFYQNAQAAENLNTAYEALPPTLKELADKVNAVHDAGGVLDKGTLSELRAAKVTNSELAQWDEMRKKMEGFSPLLKQFKDLERTAPQLFKQLTGTDQGMLVFSQLFGDPESAKRTNDIYAQVKQAQSNGNGDIKDFNEVQDTFKFKMDAAKAAVHSLGIEMGEAFLPTLKTIADVMKDVAEWFAKHEGAAKALVYTLGTLAGVWATVKTAMFIGNAVSAIVQGFTTIADVALAKMGITTDAIISANAQFGTLAATAGEANATMAAAGTSAAAGVAGVETAAAAEVAAEERVAVAAGEANAALAGGAAAGGAAGAAGAAGAGAGAAGLATRWGGASLIPLTMFGSQPDVQTVTGQDASGNPVTKRSTDSFWHRFLGFADGGIVGSSGGTLSGYSTKDDRVGFIPGYGYITLAGGEGIIRAQRVAELGGASFIDHLNNAPLSNVAGPSGGDMGSPRWRNRINWWGTDNIPRGAGPNDPILPWGPDAKGKMTPPNIFGGLPGEMPPDNNFPAPGDSRDIWWRNRRGIAGFSEGGITPGNGGYADPFSAAAMNMQGTPYSQGNRTDCSGMVARIVNGGLGLPDTSLMTTKNAGEWLAARGFRPGVGGPGSITVGWYDHGGGPNSGHMAATLPDGTPIESGGSHGNFLMGSGAQGASSPQFDHHMYLPVGNMYPQGGGFGGAGNPFAGGGGGGGAGGLSGGSSGGGGGSGGFGGGGSGGGAGGFWAQMGQRIASSLSGMLFGGLLAPLLEPFFKKLDQDHVPYFGKDMNAMPGSPGYAANLGNSTNALMTYNDEQRKTVKYQLDQANAADRVNDRQSALDKAVAKYGPDSSQALNAQLSLNKAIQSQQSLQTRIQNDSTNYQESVEAHQQKLNEEQRRGTKSSTIQNTEDQLAKAQANANAANTAAALYGPANTNPSLTPDLSDASKYGGGGENGPFRSDIKIDFQHELGGGDGLLPHQSASRGAIDAQHDYPHVISLGGGPGAQRDRRGVNGSIDQALNNWPLDNFIMLHGGANPAGQFGGPGAQRARRGAPSLTTAPGLSSTLGIQGTPLGNGAGAIPQGPYPLSGYYANVPGLPPFAGSPAVGGGVGPHGAPGNAGLPGRGPSGVPPVAGPTPPPGASGAPGGGSPMPGRQIGQDSGGSGKSNFGVTPGGTIEMAESAISTAADAIMPGSGIAAQKGMQLANRAISYGGQLAGIGLEGILETFGLNDSPLGDPSKSWPGKLAMGLSGMKPATPSTAGKSEPPLKPEPNQQPHPGTGAPPGPLVNIEHQEVKNGDGGEAARDTARTFNQYQGGGSR